MSQVVTELVIDADTSGADRFSDAMDKAASSTQGVSSSISGTMLAIAGIGGGTIAAIAGIRGVIDQVVNANKELADMQSMAERWPQPYGSASGQVWRRDRRPFRRRLECGPREIVAAAQ
jgi:hypothetical protein